MNNNVPNSDPPSAQADAWDAAVRNRLAQLRSMPVDVTRLENQLQTRISARSVLKAADRFVWMKRFPLHIRPLGAIAAGVLVLLIALGLLLSTSGGQVVASTVQMAQMHDDIVSGRVFSMHVNSIGAANEALGHQWAQLPRIPNPPHDHVMACCMRSVQNKKVACVLLQGSGEPVTLTVANAADMQSPQSPIVIHDGVAYHVQSVGSLQMVMTQRDGRWICLISRASADRLMDLAAGLQF